MKTIIAALAALAIISSPALAAKKQDRLPQYRQTSTVESTLRMGAIGGGIGAIAGVVAGSFVGHPGTGAAIGASTGALLFGLPEALLPK